jgi:hypothetical protein
MVMVTSLDHGKEKLLFRVRKNTHRSVGNKPKMIENIPTTIMTNPTVNCGLASWQSRVKQYSDPPRGT